MVTSNSRANSKSTNIAELTQLALADHRAGLLDKAAEQFEAVLNQQPRQFESLYSLGVIAHTRNQPKVALSYLDRAVQAHPRFAQVYLARATVFQSLGEHEKATADLTQAKQLQNVIDTSFTTARSLSETIAVASDLSAKGDLEAALSIYRQYLNGPDDGDYYACFFNMGVALTGVGRDAEAEACFRQSVALKPDFLLGHISLGTVLERMNAPLKAIDHWKLAVNSQPEGWESHVSEATQLYNNLGRVHEILHQYDQAEHYLTLSLKLNPDQPPALQHWIHLRQKQCRWPVLYGFDKTQAQLKEGASSLAMLSLTDEPAEQFKSAKRFVAEKVGQFDRLVPFKHHYGHDRLRIGYLSSDLSTHAVSLLTVELFEKHNREDFEVYAFCWSKEDGTSFRERVRSAFDHFYKVGAMSDEEVAKLIAAKEIDVLVDLQGITSGARPNIVARGPAPVQVAYLGFVGSSALPYVDYVVADPFIFPEELKQHFTEAPLYLPTLYQVSDSQRIFGPTPTRAELKLPQDAFVFCAFNNNYKITPEMFESWMRILRRSPNSILWLLEDNVWSKQNLKAAAMAHGVEPDRLFFAGRVLPQDYLARFRAADLLLDTSPYNAGTTANDALWAGLPLLTCPGKTYVSRMAGSLLNSAGLTELLAKDLADYENIAVKLSQQPDELKKLKARLQAAKETGKLFNTQRFTSEFEQALKELF
jgi:predicted O-linked N-acetylglucosamine transferase (SPINDLY family)